MLVIKSSFLAIKKEASNYLLHVINFHIRAGNNHMVHNIDM